MYAGIGVALGLTLGVALWLVTDQVAFLALLGLGVALGAGLDARKGADEGQGGES
ncbi:hypothetical protein [Ornithinicoccus halotolerans]|uniref:hypothetical protein n=1 Tax=Ornithinicoccus halotolerans TaxID=1748220 RepID=UPI00129808D3|nr:hypothetical protein [Ornithinicoccus halotolerans]